MIKGLESLFRRFTGQEPPLERPEAPPEIKLDDLGLTFLNEGTEHVAVRSRWVDRPLFRVAGQISGNPRKAAEWSIPIGGSALVLSHAPGHIPPHFQPDLVRCGREELPPDAQLFEFLFAQDQDELRLTFRLAASVGVTDFVAVQDTRPLFRTLPPVAQMAAVLGAVARGRRAALSLLEELAPGKVEELKRLYPPQADLAGEGVRQLHALLAGSGHPHPRSELAAMALFAELEQGTLELPEDGEPPSVSPVSLFLVSRALLVDLEQGAWDDAFGEGSYQRCLEATRKPALLGIVRGLRAPREPRPLEMLREVARQTSSRRVEAFVSECRAELMHPDTLALHGLLVALGCRADAVTVAALCAFVDVEAGGLTGDTWVPSWYALLAVAGAYGVPLRALSGGSVADLCHGAVLVQGPDGRLHGPDEGVSGRVLARLPIAEKVPWPLLEGLPFVGCWMGEETLRWDEAGEQFEGSILGHFRTSLPERYPVLTLDRDEQSDLSYRLARSEGELRSPTWAGVWLDLPAADGLELPWDELTLDQLLGRTGAQTQEAATLARVYPALAAVLGARPAYVDLPLSVWERVVAHMRTGYFRALLGEAVPGEITRWQVLPALALLGEVDLSYLALELLPREGVEYQRLRRERLDELLRSREPAVRRAAVEMLVTTGLPEDRLHPLPLEFELKRTVGDPEESVAAAACQSLARWALGLGVPSVRMLAEEEAVAAEEWPALGEVAPSSRRAALAALPVDQARVSAFLAGLNEACRVDKDKPVVLFCLMTQEELTQRRLASLQKWKFFAFSRGKSLRELLASGEDLWQEYLDFLKLTETIVRDSPTRLGSGTPLPVYRVRRPIGFWEREGELSQFFMDLVEMASRVDLDEIRVCRVRANLPPIESHFFWDVAIDPRLVDVYEPRARRFTPQLHHLCLSPAQVGYEDEEWADFEALVTLFTESRPAFRALPGLAREVASAFDLPPAYSRQILKMLVDLGRDSVYEL